VTSGIRPASTDPQHKEHIVQQTYAGLFTGLVLGFAFVLVGFADMLVVALFGAIGFLVMKAVQGELDVVTDVIDRNRKRS
jgi:nitrate reductase NapE component